MTRRGCPRPVDLTRAQVGGADEAFLAHLDECASCADAWAAHAQVKHYATQLPVVLPTDEHSADFRNALLRAARRAAPAERHTARFAWATAALCAAALLIVVGVRLFRSPSEPATVATTAPTYRGSVYPHDGARFIRVGGAPDEIVRLTHGTLTVEVQTLQPGERFRVVTNDGEVEVRGTAFDVGAEDDRLRSVRVLHGRVEVRRERAARVVLGVGERWNAPEVATADEPPPDEPVAPKRPRKPDVSEAAPPKHVDATVTDSNRRFAPKRPIEIYFEEGWSALADGQPGRAADSFERAARAAPDDPLAEDAWFWHGAALARSGKPAPAIKALGSFIDHYSRSPRVGEASAMLGWLLLDAGDLDGAEARFRAAADDPVDAVRASAAKGLKSTAQRRAAKGGQ